MHSNMRLALLLVTIVAVACSSGVDEKARAAQVATAGIAAESAKAAAVPALPTTGLWDEPHLIDRLVHAGLAPRQATGTPVGGKYWGRPVTALRLGESTLYVYFYADSLARRRVTVTLDSATAAPQGMASPYPVPRLLIVNNNLAAVFVGGTDRAQERVMLAISAGLPLPR